MADMGHTVSFWHLRDVRLAALSALFLSDGLAESVGGTAAISNLALVDALLLGGATIVRSRLRRPLRGQLGVATLLDFPSLAALLLRGRDAHQPLALLLPHHAPP